jgi:Mrp family chromosome partitioning ATPase
VPLTVFQSIPVDGIIVVTSPQELVSMIVAKAVYMAKLMNVPVLGLVENMSYIECPDCGRRIEVFGKSQAEAVAAEYGIKLLEQLPLDPVLSQEADLGKIEFNEGTQMESILGVLDSLGMNE